MVVTETKLKGCFILEPRIFEDERGYFFESFNQKTFESSTGYSVEFVQDNQSFSKYGTLRGLHFQTSQHAQAKLVRVLKGKVMDVAVDIRPSSSTFGEYIAIELSEENNKQLFIPRGFAHGFLVRSEFAEFFYKCDNYYNKVSERGIKYNDISLNIDWNFPKEKLIISKKDCQLPSFKSYFSEL